MYALVGMPGGWELFAIILVILLLFGAKKLPELARGSGRALRIFKAETKGLADDDEPQDEATKTPEQREIEARNETPSPVVADDSVSREQRDTTA